MFRPVISRKSCPFRPGDIVRVANNYSSGLTGTFVYLRPMQDACVLAPLTELLDGLIRNIGPMDPLLLTAIGHIDLNECICAHIDRSAGDANAPAL